VARSPNASSPGLAVKLVIGLAAAVVDATPASERDVAGAISMRAATTAVSAAVKVDMIEYGSRIPFLGRGVGERAVSAISARAARDSLGERVLRTRMTA